jgi:hypothetical protein
MSCFPNSLYQCDLHPVRHFLTESTMMFVRVFFTPVVRQTSQKLPAQAPSREKVTGCDTRCGECEHRRVTLQTLDHSASAMTSWQEAWFEVCPTCVAPALWRKWKPSRHSPTQLEPKLTLFASTRLQGLATRLCQWLRRTTHPATEGPLSLVQELGQLSP